MTCTHSEAEQDVALVDGMCPLCLADDLTALRERVAKLEKVEECAKKLIALRGVAYGAWVIEELEAALKSQ